MLIVWRAVSIGGFLDRIDDGDTTPDDMFSLGGGAGGLFGVTDVNPERGKGTGAPVSTLAFASSLSTLSDVVTGLSITTRLSCIIFAN
jgi:hypothetical protein